MRIGETLIHNLKSAIRNPMTTSANVHSLESIEAVRHSIGRFDEQVADALTELGAEMRRMLDWLQHDRPRFWRMQTRKATDQVHEAQQALRRCLMFPIADERPSCYEERMALKKAQARLAYCQEKEQRVRQWQRDVQHELFEYEGRITQLVRFIEVDMPQAMSVLTKIIRHLEEYQSQRASNPRAFYNDLSVANEVFPPANAEGQTEAEVESPGDVPTDAGKMSTNTVADDSAATERAPTDAAGIESEANRDAKV